MKVGDKLYCHSNINIINGHCIDFSEEFTIGSTYIISMVYENQIVVSGNINGRCRWLEMSYDYKDFNVLRYYKNWFYTIKDIRKLKLDNIKKYKI